MKNKKLAEELHKQIIRKFEKRNIHSSFIDNIWGVDLPEKQFSSEFNKWIRVFLCVFDIYNKYTWVNLLKDKKVLQLLMLFKKKKMN